MISKLITSLSKHWFRISMLVIVYTYLFLPNNNPLGDSISYAADVKWGVDLFTAHHLLFNGFYFLIYKATQFLFPGVDAFKLIGFTNGIFALGCLYILHTLLLKQTNETKKAAVWTFFVACSFGVMRFAVESEVYILPIFFSLLSSFFYLNYLDSKKNKYIFISGVFASVACLFHQIHLFWGIGLFVGLLFTQKIKPLFFFLLSTPIVLIIYTIVLVHYNHSEFTVNNLVRFLAEYYYSDTADTTFGVANFMVSVITFIRTFFQVHGVILSVLKLVPLAFVVIPLVGTIVVYSSVRIIKSIKLEISFENSPFERTHLIIFIFQLTFAIYSYGNSEFMVMLPFLMVIFLNPLVRIDYSAVRNLSVSMLIWNLSFAIIPNHFLDYQNNNELIKVIESNPDKTFIVKERNIVVNAYFYAHGVAESSRIIENADNQEFVKHKRDKAHFYTDILTKQVPYNRVDFTTKASKNKFLLVRHITKINSAMGGYTIDEVKILE